MHDILTDLVNFEDKQRLAAHPVPAPDLPKFTPLPKLKLTPATAYVLGRQMFKRSLSIMTP